MDFKTYIINVNTKRLSDYDPNLLKIVSEITANYKGCIHSETPLFAFDVHINECGHSEAIDEALTWLIHDIFDSKGPREFKGYKGKPINLVKQVINSVFSKGARKVKGKDIFEISMTTEFNKKVVLGTISLSESDFGDEIYSGEYFDLMELAKTLPFDAFPSIYNPILAREYIIPRIYLALAELRPLSDYYIFTDDDAFGRERIMQDSNISIRLV